MTNALAIRPNLGGSSTSSLRGFSSTVGGRQRFTAGILVTTSDFTNQARSAAGESPALQLVNGPQFVDLLAMNSVVLAVGEFGALTVATCPS